MTPVVLARLNAADADGRLDFVGAEFVAGGLGNANDLAQSIRSAEKTPPA